MPRELGRFIQGLESRRLLSAVLTDGLLTVEGTRRADTIDVALKRLRGGTPALEVTVNGQVTYFRLANVQRIRIDTGLGDDTVTFVRRGVTYIGGHFDWALREHVGGFLDSISGLPYGTETAINPTVISGGGGNDTLTGGFGEDLLRGGPGDDSLDGSNGNDQLQGDSGRDTLRGNNGHDRLAGNDGDDLAIGDGGHDTLSGGDGNDRLAGDLPYDDPMPVFYGDGPDAVFYAPSPHDVLTGGDGDDTFYATDSLSELRDQSRSEFRHTRFEFD